MHAPSAARRCGISILLVFAACAPDAPITAPDGSDVAGAHAAMAGRAFQLTIDVPSGRITVAPPRGSASRSGGTAFSLVGSEAIALHAGTCTFTAVPNNSKLERCTFDLALENRLQQVDLITPTTFPKPPSSAAGHGLGQGSLASPAPVSR